MKPAQTLGLLTISLALTATSGWSQSTPTGTATSTTVPQGAVAPDSTPADDNQNTRQSGRRNRANRRASKNSARTGSNTNTSPQDARYRQGSAANGTVVNSSNTTNYDVNSSVTAPTGAGSNPNSTGTPTTPPANGGANNSMSGTNSMGTGSSGSTGGRATNGGTEVSGTAAAVTGARTTKEPAIKAGSTERNTSIHDYIASSPNHVTLQNALQTANLYEMMKESGPYTLFAPSNAAFKKLPATVQAGLLEGQNRDALKQLLSYHIIQGAVDAAELTRRVKAGNGKAMLQTLAGTTLTAQAGSNGGLTLTDEQGKSISVDETDLYQANGIVHTLSGVLMPKSGTSAFK